MEGRKKEWKSSDFTGIKVIMIYYEQFHAKMFGDLGEIDEFLEGQKLAGMNQDKI